VRAVASPRPGDQCPDEPDSPWRQGADRDDVGQLLPAVLTPGCGSGTGAPAPVIHLPLNGRHGRSRYEAEVNVP
jgi:hypothetical protein